MATKDKNSFVSNVQKEYNKYQEQIKDYKEKYIMLEQALLRESSNQDNIEDIKRAKNFVRSGLNHLILSNMKYQKNLYSETHKTDYTRSQVRIHLNKKINSFYDDFYLDVLFYDDVCTPCGKYQDYLQITTEEERINFLKCNTEITHLAFVYAPQTTVKAVIGILGKLNTSDTRVQECGITLLDCHFSDFQHLRLSDTNSIPNNDLKQLIQSKIDLDKENMKLLASLNIRGDEYKILKNEDDTLYIRYICRGTGRVYYNRLNINNLRISEEFKQDDYESYLKAWWNLNTLGSPVNGKPVIRL